MQNITFFGLGNMGSGMVKNLKEKGFELTLFDINHDTCTHYQSLGFKVAQDARSAVQTADFVISMLPAQSHVESLYFDPSQGIANHLPPSTMVIDCSTISADAAKECGHKLAALGHAFIDAPVSGGVAGASLGTLTFICGGQADDIGRAHPIFMAMGQKVFHAGAQGAGQVAKICNNMLLAILMAGTSEALSLAINSGLDPAVVSDIMRHSSGNNWTLEKYNPCPNVMPSVPSSNNYEPGFMVALMQKDLSLALDCASRTDATVPLGELVRSLYASHADKGNQTRDFSSIFEFYQ